MHFLRDLVRNLLRAFIRHPGLLIVGSGAVAAARYWMSTQRTDEWNGLHVNLSVLRTLPWLVFVGGFVVAVVYTGSLPYPRPSEPPAPSAKPVPKRPISTFLGVLGVLAVGAFAALTLRQLDPPTAPFVVAADPRIVVAATVTDVTCLDLLAGPESGDVYFDLIRDDCESQRSTRELVWVNGLLIVLGWAFLMAVATAEGSPKFDAVTSTIMASISLVLGWVSLNLIVSSAALRGGVLIGWVVVAALQASGRRFTSLGRLGPVADEDAVGAV